ncbi:hypothetical protein NDU88_000701 [Pleurodeles waltl]|uniref:Uncharacterized protein n=1 Tax=Pleurodeles waltl TaxID=8319 RepID=A0AAV7R831_PLEWA|nr:hypothetical protein NDU88_000701 [Pleurodeles waltl]
MPRDAWCFLPSKSSLIWQCQILDLKTTRLRGGPSCEKQRRHEHRVIYGRRSVAPVVGTTLHKRRLSSEFKRLERILGIVK